MRVSKKTLLLAAAAAVLAAACSDPTVVATVDETSIDEAEVTVLRHSYAEGTGYNAEAFRVDLTNLIYVEAQKNAAARDFGLTNLDDSAVISAKIQNPAPDEVAIFESVAADPDRTDATTEAVAEQLVIRDAVAAELADDEAFLTDIFENQPELVSEVCARHILVATPEEAEAVKVRLDAGEDFATIAAEVSLDPGSVGGQLPCPTPAANYVQEFSHMSATLPIGEVSAPVPTEFGWHIIVVDERTAPETVDALIADPMAYLHISAVRELWIPWVNEAIRTADVEIASQVGTWAGESFGILPPPAG
ncbi:MAG: peptidylprolyl isomerase [Acidimicrobiia bacterium]